MDNWKWNEIERFLRLGFIHEVVNRDVRYFIQENLTQLCGKKCHRIWPLDVIKFGKNNARYDLLIHIVSAPPIFADLGKKDCVRIYQFKIERGEGVADFLRDMVLRDMVLCIIQKSQQWRGENFLNGVERRE